MSYRSAVAEIDLGALRANVETLAALAGDAAFMAVVKADAYGHGAVPVARAALDAGADWLGVATVEEGVGLREAGIDTPVLVLSEPLPSAAEAVVANRLVPVVYSERWIDALAEAVAASGHADPLPVHLKVDTGMHRAGCDHQDAVTVAKAIGKRAELRFQGLMTHLAVADEPGHPATADQLTCFDNVRAALEQVDLTPEIVHAANSAATITLPETHYDLVRCGIAIYGIPPSPALDGLASLQPVMRLRAQVAQVRRVAAGEGISYGHRYRPDGDATIAVLPLGYGDGVPRRLGLAGGEVLIGGRRRPVAGTVTMDQFMVDCGDDSVSVGDEAVLIGRQGEHEITANEWAEHLDTIGYEITCGIATRVPRRYRGATG